MRVYLSIIIFFLNCFSSWSQTDLYFPLSTANRFDWNTIQLGQDPELIKRCVIQNKTDFEWYFLNEDYSPTLEDLRNSLHLIDLNGDGKLDIIFDGESGGEPYSIKIFLQVDNQFKKILDAQQGIKEMSFENGILSKIYISDWGCCAEIIHQNYTFNADFRDKLNPLKRSCSSQAYEKLVWPNNYNKTPLEFRTITTHYNLRFEPKLDDSTNYEIEPGLFMGNSIGKIIQNSTGFALAEKTDETGRVWWFVALNSYNSLKNTLYYTNKNQPNSYYLGWISSRFVEKL